MSSQREQNFPRPPPNNIPPLFYPLPPNRLTQPSQPRPPSTHPSTDSPRGYNEDSIFTFATAVPATTISSHKNPASGAPRGYLDGRIAAPTLAIDPSLESPQPQSSSSIIPNSSSMMGSSHRYLHSSGYRGDEAYTNAPPSLGSRSQFIGTSEDNSGKSNGKDRRNGDGDGDGNGSTRIRQGIQKPKPNTKAGGGVIISPPSIPVPNPDSKKKHTSTASSTSSSTSSSLTPLPVGNHSQQAKGSTRERYTLAVVDGGCQHVEYFRGLIKLCGRSNNHGEGGSNFCELHDRDDYKQVYVGFIRKYQINNEDLLPLEKVKLGYCISIFCKKRLANDGKMFCPDCVKVLGERPCTECREGIPLPGKDTCEDCLDKRNSMLRKLKEDKLCRKCKGTKGKIDPQFNRVHCNFCHEKIKEDRQAKEQKRADNGMCARCGKVKREEGFKTCAACQERSRKTQAKHKSKKETAKDKEG